MYMRWPVHGCTFMNFNFSTGVAAVNVPNDAYLGLGVGGWLTDKIYAIAGFGDINSDPTDIFKGFDTFFNKNEYFKHLEVGITSSKDYMLLDNIHSVYVAPGRNFCHRGS